MKSVSASVCFYVKLNKTSASEFSVQAVFSGRISTISLPWEHATDLILADRNKASVHDSQRNWLQTDGCVFATKKARVSILTPALGLSDLSLHHPSLPPPSIYPSLPKAPPWASSGFSLHLGLMPKASQACSSQAATTLQPSLLICTDLQGGVAGNSGVGANP